MSPPLSIVIPTRDTRELTLRCLAAVARELPPGAEVVVVDDGSRDDTVAAITTRFAAARVVTLPVACGFSAAVNAGVTVATGAVRLILNSDTEVRPGALAALVAAFAEHPRLGAAGARLYGSDGDAQWSGGRAPDGLWLLAVASGIGALAGRLPGYRRWKPVGGHGAGAIDRAAGAIDRAVGAIDRAVGVIEWLPGTALAVRAEAWHAVGPFDEALGLYAQDLDFCLGLRDTGWELAVVDAARVVHVGGATVAERAGATSARQDPAELWTGLVRVAAKRRGARAGSATAHLLRLGAALRIACRTVALPFVPRARRAVWRRDTRIYRGARAALAAFA